MSSLLKVPDYTFDRRCNFTKLKEGAHIPGYVGYIPDLKFQSGKTFGEETHILNLLKSPPKRELPPLKFKVSDNTKPNVSKIIAGYGGHIPHFSTKFGKSFSICLEASIAEFLYNYNLNKALQSEVNHSWQNSSRLPQVSDNKEVREQLNNYVNLRKSEQLLKSLGCNKYDMIGLAVPGYKGHIPYWNTGASVGRTHSKCLKAALKAFLKETNKDVNNNKEDSSEEEYKNASFRIYTKDGLIPNYQGFIPKYCETAGLSFTKASMKLPVCNHDKKSYGEYIKSLQEDRNKF